MPDGRTWNRCCSPGLPGGQLTITTEVENYPPFPGGIQGPELMNKFREHAAHFTKEIIDDEVTGVDFSQRPFKVSYHGGDRSRSRSSSRRALRPSGWGCRVNAPCGVAA